MDDFHGHCGETSKPDKRVYTLCDSIFIMFKSRQKQFMLLEIRIVVTLGARCSLERNTRKRAFFGSESVFSLDMDGSFTGIFMRITELHT